MSYVRTLQPAKYSFVQANAKKIFVITFAITLITALEALGTVRIENYVTVEMLTGVAGVIMVLAVAYLAWLGHFPKEYVEPSYNHEAYVGRKRGEFRFELHGKTFHGVDCGGQKIVLLQGTVANHEKKVVKPQKKGAFYSLGSLTGRPVERLVIRGTPIVNPVDVVELGWLGKKEVVENPAVKANLERLIQSPSWAGTIWIAPYIPDGLYKQFLFNEKTLGEIETEYEGRIGAVTRDFNDRVRALKNHYMTVSSNVFFQMVKTVRNVIGASDNAMLIVLYLLEKKPQEIQDAVTALRLEGGTGRLHRAIEKKLSEFEEIRKMIPRLEEIFGRATPEKVEMEVSALKRMYEGLKEKVKTVTGGD